ncbi:hypothetical protein WS62_05820 [Burkholderia sp. ABCPW 14]|nr:hypothetical protein WS62_05820 [Burkholderia sp. ABCPW 14]
MSDQIRREFDSMSECAASRQPVAMEATPGDAGPRSRASWKRRIEWHDAGERGDAVAERGEATMRDR